MHFVYLAENAGIDTAERFLVRADESFEVLSQMPLMGPLVELRRADLPGIRNWRVIAFENFLIFYLPLKGGIDVVRVIHAAQDWIRILDE